MAKFNFKMENILNVKGILEREAENTYRIASSELRLEEDKLSDCYSKLETVENKNRNARNGVFRVSDLHYYQERANYEKEKYKNQALKVNVANKNCNLASSKLHSAKLERKTYEKLKEKEFEEYKLEQKKVESSIIDEFVSYSYKRVGDA